MSAYILLIKIMRKRINPPFLSARTSTSIISARSFIPDKTDSSEFIGVSSQTAVGSDRCVNQIISV